MFSSEKMLNNLRLSARLGISSHVFPKCLKKLKIYIAKLQRLPSASFLYFLAFCNLSSAHLYGRTCTLYINIYITRTFFQSVLLRCSTNAIKCIYKAFTMCCLLLH